MMIIMVALIIVVIFIVIVVMIVVVDLDGMKIPSMQAAHGSATLGARRLEQARPAPSAPLTGSSDTQPRNPPGSSPTA